MLSNDHDLVIVKSIVSLAHNLDMAVVAEGVENQETLDYLKSINCTVVQGFHISRPVEVNQLEAFLS